MKILVLPLLMAFSFPANAHEIKVGDLVIVHPMVDEAEKGQVSAKGSVKIRNEGKTPDQLLSISAEFAEKAAIDLAPPWGWNESPFVLGESMVVQRQPYGSLPLKSGRGIARLAFRLSATSGNSIL